MKKEFFVLSSNWCEWDFMVDKKDKIIKLSSVFGIIGMNAGAEDFLSYDLRANRLLTQPQHSG